MINNFSLIKSLILFDDEDPLFLHCQLVIRKKDRPDDMSVVNKIVGKYFIKGKNHLSFLENEIIMLCEYYGARAYINLSAKGYKSLQYLMMLKLADVANKELIIDSNRLLHSAADELISKNPKWVVDIDDVNLKDSIKETILTLYWDYLARKYPSLPSSAIRKDHKVICGEVPTRNGVHLITKPFNLEEFNKLRPGIAVHKNSMGTLLYYPNSLK